MDKIDPFTSDDTHSWTATYVKLITLQLVMRRTQVLAAMVSASTGRHTLESDNIGRKIKYFVINSSSAVYVQPRGRCRWRWLAGRDLANRIECWMNFHALPEEGGLQKKQKKIKRSLWQCVRHPPLPVTRSKVTNGSVHMHTHRLPWRPSSQRPCDLMFPTSWLLFPSFF